MTSDTQLTLCIASSGPKGPIGLAVCSRLSYRELRERLTEVHNLDRASAVLTWDERTKMPPGGAAARADQFATLVRVKHCRMAADEVGRLLSELSSYEAVAAT